MGVIVLTVMIQGPRLPSSLKGDPAYGMTLIDSGVFEAIGVISFAYVCHHNTLLIYGSLRTPTLDRWNRITHISTGLSVVASLIMAVTGYSIFVSTKPTDCASSSDVPETSLSVPILTDDKFSLEDR